MVQLVFWEMEKLAWLKPKLRATCVSVVCFVDVTRSFAAHTTFTDKSIAVRPQLLPFNQREYEMIHTFIRRLTEHTFNSCKRLQINFSDKLLLLVCMALGVKKANEF